MESQAPSWTMSTRAIPRDGRATRQEELRSLAFPEPSDQLWTPYVLTLLWVTSKILCYISHNRDQNSGLYKTERLRAGGERGQRYEPLGTPGDSVGQGSLACCSPWSHKELDMTWRLNNSQLWRWWWWLGNLPLLPLRKASDNQNKMKSYTIWKTFPFSFYSILWSKWQSYNIHPPMIISCNSFIFITNMPEGKENMSKLLDKSNRLTICFILKTSKNQQLLTFFIFAADEFLNKASQM